MRVLMCPPTYYKVLWEINPWMKIANQPDEKKAREQWENLFKIYQKLKLKVLLIPPQKGLADMIFTANAGWGKGNRFVVSNFKHKERKKEEIFYIEWLKSQRFKVLSLPKNIYFEGGGDIVTTKDYYIFGYGPRSSLAATDYLKKLLNLKKPFLPLKLTNGKFFHLDTALFYIKHIDTIFYYPEAFDKDSQRKIENLKMQKFAVSEKEANNFALNSVYYKKTIIMSSGNEKMKNFLKEKRFNIISINISEFKKAGGGIKCLTLFLN